MVSKISHTALQTDVDPEELKFKSRDELYIRDMLIPLTAEQAFARNKQLFGIKPDLLWDTDGSAEYLYTCKYWDETTHLCTNYENRPDMCRNYPAHGLCQFGCGNMSVFATQSVKKKEITWK